MAMTHDLFVQLPSNIQPVRIKKRDNLFLTATWVERLLNGCLFPHRFTVEMTNPTRLHIHSEEPFDTRRIEEVLTSKINQNDTNQEGLF
jgi:hypothetical protein